MKSLEQKNDSDLTILFALRSKKFIRLHNSMTNSLQKICKNCNCQINEGPDSNKFDALITNYDGNGIDLLIEAKSSILRPHLRLAVGQLWDYRRGLGRHIATHLAVLLPQKPDFESLEFLNYIGIKTLWFTNKTLKKIEGNFLTKISNKV